MMLWKTCAALKEEGQVMVVGDLNARVGSMQFQPMMQDELDKGETIELDPLWQRYVVDDTVNQHGKALYGMVNGMYMPILNGMCLFPNTGGIPTVLQSGGSSVLDYVIAHMDI